VSDAPPAAGAHLGSHLGPPAGQRSHREPQASASDAPPAAGAHLGSHLGPAFSSRPRLRGGAGGRPRQAIAKGAPRRRLR
jgi:hypothetical protein